MLINFEQVKDKIPKEYFKDENESYDKAFCRWMAIEHKIAMFPCSLLTLDSSFEFFAWIVIAKSNEFALKVKEWF